MNDIRRRLDDWMTHCAEDGGSQDYIDIFELHAADDIAFLLAAVERAALPPQNWNEMLDAEEQHWANVGSSRGAALPPAPAPDLEELSERIVQYSVNCVVDLDMPTMDIVAGVKARLIDAFGTEKKA